MTAIGYHASHEQFPPSELLALVKRAESAGFTSAKSSDHFHPWSERQGQSGFAWAWLGAAMQSSSLPFGVISTPGWRYHPAVLAQAAATIGEMFPGRLWLALGSGEAINEAMTGATWPDKPERNLRLDECVNIIRALFAGESVTHRGRVQVVEAKLYTRASVPIPLFGAAATPDTAAWAGQWADGLLTTGGNIESVRQILDAFHDNGGAGKPVHVQHALSWAPSEAEALASAIDQWGPLCAGGDLNWNLSRPADFDRIGRLVGEEAIRKSVAVSADPGQHAEWIADLMALGVAAVHLHCVGRNQEEFIDCFGARVLPQL